MRVKFFSLFIIVLVILALSIQGSNAAVKKKRTCRYDCTELCQLQGTSHGTCQGSICKCSSLNTVVEHINEHET
ncbi:unnamed protein product [Spodoptera exigua]|nr:unnamed protein product [Spodoptera exigua]